MELTAFLLRERSEREVFHVSIKKNEKFLTS
jgi:hypothetical protein